MVSDNEKHLNRLAQLRDDWSDEIPAEVVHSDSKIKTKARRSWFQGVVASTDMALEMGEIDDSNKVEVAEKLVETYTSESFIQQELTTQDNITTANNLIDIVLGRKIDS